MSEAMSKKSINITAVAVFIVLIIIAVVVFIFVQGSNSVVDQNDAQSTSSPTDSGAGPITNQTPNNDQSQGDQSDGSTVTPYPAQ